MRVKLTLHREQREPTDVVVTADSTATVEDVARQIKDADPDKTISASDDDVLSLAVAPPTAAELVPLSPDTLIGEAAIGSGFNAQVVNLGRRLSRASMHDAVEVVATMHVLSGPAAGQEFRLREGHAAIGRDPANDIVLADPMVSKRHARIEVGQHIEIVDLNSANGVIVDGASVQRLNVIPGQQFTIGESELVIHVIGSYGAAGEDPVLERGGSLLFNRSPRVEPRYPGEEFKSPRLPQDRVKDVFPWFILIAPIIAGVGLYAITNNPRTIMIVAVTPLMMLGNFLNQRTRLGQQTKQQELIFERQYEELEEKFYREVPVERSVRNEEAPPVAVVFDQAMKLGQLLWTRRPEHWNFLTLRFGTGVDNSRNSIADASDINGLPEFEERVDHLRERYREIENVPIVDSLLTSGSFGVAGPKSLASDALRGLAVQMFGLHAPNEVVAVALAEPQWVEELEWLKWLPHTSSERNPLREAPLADSASSATAILNQLEEIVIGRSQGKPSRMKPFKDKDGPMTFGADVAGASAEANFKGETAIVVIVTNDTPVDRPRLTQILERGPEVGVYTLFVAPTVESLPSACRTFLDVSKGLEDASVGVVRTGKTYEGVQVEGVSQQYMEMFAKRLAPVVDSSTVVEDDSDIPNSVMFLSLVGTELAESSSAIIERWRQNNTIIDRSGAVLPRLKKAGNLRAIIGQGASDAMTLDLRTQGPHALVGGTTGAGKSEFLQAWVLGMATAHSPDRVTFLFVDYKGGSAFADCVELPHCVGLVTDLSPHLVQRALTSLRAELHYREHLFNRKKAKDLLELEKRQDPETPPALVLVIDEFAALAGEVPEFVDGVVDIAQRGRSLGIHLIMATQRPAGVIKDNLRANTNLRVALRMADESDSRDVVDDPIAGSFSPSIPGRGIAKTGPGRLTMFQSAYAGGWTTDDDDVAADVRIAELRFGSVQNWESDVKPTSDTEDEDLGPNDQKRIVQTIIKAADRAELPVPRRPWLDDLPTIIDLLELPAHGDSKIPYGMIDVPERQRQDPIYFEPDREGSMAIYGTSGSGKTNMLKALAIGAGLRPETGRTEVYALDFASGALRSMEVLPQVGSVIDGDDAERVQRLLRSLGRELDRRSKLFADVQASNLTEYREMADRSMSRILLMVDNFQQFREEWDMTSARMPFFHSFMRILGEGRPLGVHAIVTADRSGAIPAAVVANISRRVVLRMSEQSAYSSVNAPNNILDENSPPGRAIVDAHEVQVGVIGGTGNVAKQSTEMEQLAQRLREAGAEDVEEIGALPTKVSAADMPDSVDGLPVIGVAEDTLAPRGFEAIGTFSVSGPIGSGKTNALKALIVAMEKVNPDVKLFHFSGRRSALQDFRPWVRSSSKIEEIKEIATELTDLLADESITEKVMVVVENVPQFEDTDAERPLRKLYQAINNSDHFLVGDLDITRANGSYGYIGDFKASRTGIVLKPDQGDGDTVFKIEFPKIRRSEFPEGRGMFVQDGRFVMVHVPLAEDAEVAERV